MHRLFVSVLLVSIISCSVYGARMPDDPESFCQEYLDAIHAQDWTRAREFWLPEELEKSSRFGITYQGISAKFDCASALITNADKVAAGLINVSIKNINSADNEAEFDIQQIYRSDTIQTRYYAQNMNGRWYFVSSMYAYAGDWRKYPTRFVNVYCHDTSLVNDYALGMLDDFIDSTGRLFDISSDRMALLEKEKLDYYLCSENEFERLTGYNAHGITILPFDAIITRHLPHKHEITHFMINYALQNLPLYTIPMLQEGLAVAEGGRWEKAPAVLDQLGYVLLKNQYCSLDELLTFDNFNIDLGMPDISYPVSGLFVNYLIDRKGMDKFKKLYMELSASLDEIRSWDKPHIVSVFENYLGCDWNSIRQEFASYCERYEKGDIFADSMSMANAPVRMLDSHGCKLKIYENSDDYYIIVDSLPDTQWAAILFIDPADMISSSYQSSLFYDHFTTGSYKGQKYALRLSSEEAGFYNYYTDILEAKYIRSFDPDSPYWNPEKHTVRFGIKKTLLPKPIEKYDLIFSL